MAGAGDSAIAGEAGARVASTILAKTLVAILDQWLHPRPRASGVLRRRSRDVCGVAIGATAGSGRSLLHRGATERLYVLDSGRVLTRLL